MARARRAAVRPLLRRRRHHAAVRRAGRRLCRAHRRPRPDRRAVAGPAAPPMGWIEGDGDSDGDGFLDYARGADTGLANQGWKDSEDSVFHADGRFADGPDRAGRGAGLRLRRLPGHGRARARGAATPRRPTRWSGAGRARCAARSRSGSGWRSWASTRIALDGDGELCRVRGLQPRPPAVHRPAARRTGPSGWREQLLGARLQLRLGHPHAGARASRATTRCPTTTARSGRTTRRCARAGHGPLRRARRRGAAAERACSRPPSSSRCACRSCSAASSARPASRRSPIRSPACRRPGRRARCS